MDAVPKSGLPNAEPCTNIEQLSCPTGLLTGEIFSRVDTFCEHNVDSFFCEGFLRELPIFLHVSVYRGKYFESLEFSVNFIQ